MWGVIREFRNLSLDKIKGRITSCRINLHPEVGVDGLTSNILCFNHSTISVKTLFKKIDFEDCGGEVFNL